MATACSILVARCACLYATIGVKYRHVAIAIAQKIPICRSIDIDENIYVRFLSLF